MQDFQEAQVCKIENNVKIMLNIASRKKSLAALFHLHTYYYNNTY